MHTVHGEYSVHMECACTLYNAHEVLLIAALHFQLLMHKISFYSFSYQPHSNLTLTWCWSPFESSIMFMIISRTKYFCHFGSMATRYINANIQCTRVLEYSSIPAYMPVFPSFQVSWCSWNKLQQPRLLSPVVFNVQQHQGQNIEGFTSTLSSSSAFIFAFGLGGVG